MPKPPFVPKEDVEAFIRAYLAEHKKFPTTAEMRSHFMGGSMNRYSAILRDMNLSKPQKERPMKLDYTEEQTLLSAVSAIFEKKLEAEVAKKTQSESELRSAALEDLADEKEKVEALELSFAKRRSCSKKSSAKKKRFSNSAFKSEMQSSSRNFNRSVRKPQRRKSDLRRNLQRCAQRSSRFAAQTKRCRQPAHFSKCWKSSPVGNW